MNDLVGKKVGKCERVRKKVRGVGLCLLSTSLISSPDNADKEIKNRNAGTKCCQK